MNRGLRGPSLPQGRVTSKVAQGATTSRQLPTHKLVRINGHVYAVVHKAGKRALVRQAAVRKAATSVLVI